MTLDLRLKIYNRIERDTRCRKVKESCHTKIYNRIERYGFTASGRYKQLMKRSTIELKEIEVVWTTKYLWKSKDLQ